MTTLLRLETLSSARNFNDQVYAKVRPFLGRRVLEVGMGIGIFTEKLLARADAVAGLDVVPEFVEISRKKFAAEPKVSVHLADIGAGVPSAIRGESFDTILCMNVLEHIEKDAKVLADFFSLLDPGGRLILVVPQYPWLFNGLDSNDGHFRRYRRGELLGALAGAGFQVVHCESFNMAGILGWLFNGTLLGRKDLPTGQMALYDRLAPLLFKLDFLGGRRVGLSLLAVGRKP